MRKDIIKVFLSAFFLISKLVFSQGNEEEPIAGIKMIVSTDKSTYLEGEVIWKELLLIVDKNVVKLDYKPAFYPNGDLQETVTNSKNHGMQGWDPSYTTMGKIPTDYPDTIRLFDVLNIGVLEGFPNIRIIYLPSDEYEFTATVNVAVKGKNYKVKSVPYKFKVLKPEGDEALARKEYLELILSLRSESSNIKIVKDKVDNFIEIYPNSKYVDQVLRVSKIPYFMNFKNFFEDVITYYENFINKYPDFASNYERLSDLKTCFESMNDLDGYNKFLNKLKSKNKDNITLNKVLFYLGEK